MSTYKEAVDHRCKVCKSLWHKWPDGHWSVAYHQTPGSCCDNAPGERFEENMEPEPVQEIKTPYHPPTHSCHLCGSQWISFSDGTWTRTTDRMRVCACDQVASNGFYSVVLPIASPKQRKPEGTTDPDFDTCLQALLGAYDTWKAAPTPANWIWVLEFKTHLKKNFGYSEPVKADTVTKTPIDGLQASQPSQRTREETEKVLWGLLGAYEEMKNQPKHHFFHEFQKVYAKTLESLVPTTPCTNKASQCRCVQQVPSTQKETPSQSGTEIAYDAFRLKFQELTGSLGAWLEWAKLESHYRLAFLTFAHSRIKHYQENQEINPNLNRRPCGEYHTEYEACNTCDTRPKES